jgi:hypothetical protein
MGSVTPLVVAKSLSAVGTVEGSDDKNSDVEDDDKDGADVVCEECKFCSINHLENHTKNINHGTSKKVNIW